MPLSSTAKTHLILAAAQIFVVTYICKAFDIWRSDATSEQFPGHLGPAIFIAAFGVTGLCHDWPWKTRALVEGRMSVAAGATYVLGEGLARLLVKGPTGTLDHYMKHGLHAWMSLVVLLCGAGFLTASRLTTGERLRRAPHVWFAVAWGWFIWAHKQPNDFGVAMHAATAGWVALGAYHRLVLPGAPREAGACQIMAAYTFFGGQTGLTLSAAAWEFDVGAYILVWHALAITAVLAYVRLFLGASATAGYAPVALSDECPGELEEGRGRRKDAESMRL